MGRLVQETSMATARRGEKDGLSYQQSPLEIDYSDTKLVRMNLNENLIFPPNLLRSILRKCTDKLDPRYYPDELGTGEMKTLTDEIARYCGCSRDFVSIGVGGDQLIDLIFRMKVNRRKGKPLILTVDPTF